MKKRILMLVVLGLTMVMVTGCGTSHDRLTKKAVGTMEEMAAVLRTVTDKESAERAAPKLEKLGEKMQELSEARDELGEPDEATQKKLDAKYGEKMDAAVGAFMKEASRVARDPELSAALDAMPDMDD